MISRLSRRDFLQMCMQSPLFLPNAGIDTDNPTPRGPRLLTNRKNLVRVKRLLKTRSSYRPFYDRLIDSAALILQQPMLTITWDPGRKIILSAAREALRRSKTLGLAWLLSDDRRFTDRLAAEMLYICRQPDWNPEHFLDTAELTAAAAIALDWCSPAFSTEVRNALTNAIIFKGLQPGERQFSDHAGWTSSNNNWNVVCNAGLLLGAIAVSNDHPLIANSTIRRCGESIANGFSSFEPDGGWAEGMGYWDYATQYGVYILSTIEASIARPLSSREYRGFFRTNLFRQYMNGPSGKVFNYGDASQYIGLSEHMMWIGFQNADPTFENWCTKTNIALTTGVLWLGAATSKIRKAVPKFARFRDVEIVSFRSSWDDPGALFMAIKGGSNSANHSDLDLGTFVLDSDHERFAMDLGAGDYTLADYFEHPEREGIFEITTSAQNTLSFGGKNQQVSARGTIISFEKNADAAMTVIDISDAYPGFKSIQRGVTFETDRIMMVDEIVSGANDAMRGTWQMISDADIFINDNIITLSVGKALLWLKVILPEMPEIRIVELDATTKKHKKPPKRIDIHFNAVFGMTRVVILFTPNIAELDLHPEILPLAQWPLHERWNTTAARSGEKQQ
jgi:hypothetical protein